MKVKDAELFLEKMDLKNHDVNLFFRCVKALKNKPNILIKFSSLISLYVTKVDSTAVVKLLSHNFINECDKIHQLEVLSSLSYSSATPERYLPIILNNNRSIAFEIRNDDYDSYCMLLNTLPKDYSFCHNKISKNGELISIWKK